MSQTTIGIQEEIRDQLREWKSPGQSYSGAIEELLEKQEVKVSAE